MKPLARVTGLAVMALALSAAAPKTVGWNSTVAITPDGGHLLGNPDAGVKVVEYLAYTSPHSLQFEREAEAQLKVFYISSGRVSLEVRPIIINPLDVTLTLLASCGAKEKFWLNHAALMRSQDEWREIVLRSTSVQRARWKRADLAASNRAVATDLRLYEVMESRGYDRPSVDKCLADSTGAKRIADQNDQARAAGIDGVPVFSINGVLLKDVHTWAALRPEIDARL